ncbi:MAG: HEPN domain-containing protein [Actinomycetota bacterium]|nr:HEPN domain-containing protein [Actinomycetota bacterium]
MAKLKTRRVERSLYVNYLKRAKECLTAARRSFDAREWNASAINSIHSAIAAIDALCVFFLGQRHAGESHDGVVELFRTIKELDRKDLNNIVNRTSRILGIKNMAEYEERLVYSSEAEKALKDAERLLRFVKTKLPK